MSGTDKSEQQERGKHNMLTILTNMPEGTRFTAIRNPDNVKVRCLREADAVFVFAPRKSRYGRRYSLQSFASAYTVVIKDKNKEWQKRLKRARKSLETSGLWPEWLARIRNMQTMTWEDRLAMKNVFDKRYDCPRPSDAEMHGAWVPFAAKYPFAFTHDSRGYLQIDTNYIWEMSECRLKSMYFGKASNSFVKRNLRSAISGGLPYRYHVQAGYDVTVEYIPDKQAAFYSEEYRGTGNGHYYLALDHNTAMFCEDD